MIVLRREVERRVARPGELRAERIAVEQLVEAVRKALGLNERALLDASLGDHGGVDRRIDAARRGGRLRPRARLQPPREEIEKRDVL